MQKTSNPVADRESSPPATPRFFDLFRHTDGGIYRFVRTALHSDDKAELYLYEHVWPFEAGVLWARPATEWASRFTAIAPESLVEATKQDNGAARAAVLEAKTKRREAAGTLPLATPASENK